MNGKRLNNMNKKVSIITPCLNSEATIRQTIESVLKQIYPNIEYIIIDGCSRDGTVQIIEEYLPLFQGRMRYVSEKDNGVYDAMNKGIRQASGDIIGIINSDDWYEFDAVESVVTCFKNTDADVIHGEIWVINERGEREYQTAHSVFPMHPSTFIKREIYKKYGMFDIGYRIAADRELLLRLMAEGVRFEHTDRIFANFRETGISTTQVLACAEETYAVDRKYLGKCPEYILNERVIEEKYSRKKLVYISDKKPERVKDIITREYGITEGVVIFGAGFYGRELEMVLSRCNIPVRFFADNSEEKWGLELHGIRILSPEILRYGSVHVIISSIRFQKDICQQLKNYSNPNLKWNSYEEIWQSVINKWGVF